MSPASAASSRDPRPLVAHVVYRFDTGGLENGVANLVNHLPAASYRHAIIALTEVTQFRQRIVRDDVLFFSLNKPPGHGIRLYPRLHVLFRELRPAIVHSRNLAALEAVVPACTAGVPVRVHAEHGRDVGDLDGTVRKYQWLRRAYKPFVSHYIALSRDLERYLVQRVGVPSSRVEQIYNGVDALRFHPVTGARELPADAPFRDPASWIVGTVGRMQDVKDPLNLAHGFVQALAIAPELRSRLRLVMVGDGPLRAAALSVLDAAGVRELAWLPGERHDVAAMLRGFDLFALPSRAEGISNTILEAMATGLPVVATDVGGNAELLVDGETGALVPAADPRALAEQLVAHARDPEAARRAGRAGRERAERLFSLSSMVERYRALYDQLLARRSSATGAAPASDAARRRRAAADHQAVN